MELNFGYVARLVIFILSTKNCTKLVNRSFIMNYFAFMLFLLY
jgi:uncharacterized protein with PQ loop repeat